MSYLKINGEKTKYKVSIQPFTSQHGRNAVRFVGESVPETDKGFKYYSDDDTLISDLSEYTHLYNPNEYTTKEDNIEYPAPNNKDNPSPNSIVERLNLMSQQIADITPYTETKIAYIDETEIIFTSDKEGKVLVSAIDSYGDSVDALVERENEKITVSFLKPIESVTKVTISIQ